MAFDVGTAVGYLDLDTSGFKKGFKSALGDLETFSNKSNTTGERLTALGSSMTSVGSSLTKYVTTPLLGAGAAMVTVTAGFESAMSEVAAISGATGDDFEDLSQKAKDMGAATKFSASEAAEAFKYMAMAGWKTEDMLSGIEGVLNLAAASGEALGTTSDIVTDALTAFGLTASDAAHFSDVLAAASNNANTNVSMLGESFKYVAPVAGAMGYSVEDTSIALGLMANSGIKASQAGTALRTIMTNMAKPTDTVATAMEALGLSLTDSEGNMKSLGVIMEDLRAGFNGLTEAEQANLAASLAGKEGMSGLLAIVNATEKDFNSLNEAIYGADGTAGRMAETMQDNLSGQLVILKSALEGIAISFGELLLPAVKSVVSWLQNLADKINSLSDSQKEAIVKIAAVVAAIGPALLIVGKLIKTLGSLPTTLKSVKAGFTVLKGAIGSISAPVVAVIAIVATLAAAFKHLWETNEEFRENITAIWESIKAAFSEFTDGILERINSLGFEFESITEVLSAIWNGFCELLAPVFEGAFNYIALVLSTVFDTLLSLADFFIAVFSGDWEAAWESVKQIFYTIGEFLMKRFELVVDTLKSVADVFLGWFGSTWDKAWGAIKQFFVDTWNAVVSFFTTTAKSIVTGVSNFIDTVVEFFENLPETLAYWLGFALGKIAAWIVNLGKKAAEAGPKFVDAVVKFFSELPGKIENWLTKTIQKLSSWGTNAKNKATEAGSNFVNSVVSYLSQLPDKFNTWLTKVLTYLSGIPSKMYNIGKSMLKNLWDGLKSVWNDLWSWVSRIGDKISSTFSSFVSGAKAGYSGSYATGLDYVPRDMLVKVHEGETIRTKQQTKSELSGEKPAVGGNQPLIVNLTVDGRTLGQVALSNINNITETGGVVPLKI